MIKGETFIRVRYADTDQMGFVYYGKYPEYFEVGRVELIRQLGITYKELEAKGIFMPVAELKIQYKIPATYDEKIKVVTSIPELPRASMLTTYEVFKENGQLSATGSVKLAFIDQKNLRPVRVPAYVSDAVVSYWQTE